jgi:hypothetical protein
VRCGGRKGREANWVGESQGPAVFKGEEAGLGVRGWVCCLNEWAAASLYTSPNPNHAPETTRQMRTPRPRPPRPLHRMSLHPRRGTQALSRTMHHYIIREHFSGDGGEALDGRTLPPPWMGERPDACRKSCAASSCPGAAGIPQTGIRQLFEHVQQVFFDKTVPGCLLLLFG